MKDENKSKEIAAIVLCGIGVFMLFSIFNKTGPIGRFLTAIFYGLFGRAAAIVIMIALFVIAWQLIRRGKGPSLETKKMVLFVCFVLFLSAFYR